MCRLCCGLVYVGVSLVFQAVLIGVGVGCFAATCGLDANAAGVFWFVRFAGVCFSEVACAANLWVWSWWVWGGFGGFVGFWVSWAGLGLVWLFGFTGVGLAAMFGFGLWGVVRVVVWIPLAGVLLFCFRLGFGFIVWLGGVVGCCGMCCFSGCVAVVLGCLADGGGYDFVVLRFAGMYGWGYCIGVFSLVWICLRFGFVGGVVCCYLGCCLRVVATWLVVFCISCECGV